MKKTIVFILIVTLTACIFAGCGNNKASGPSDSPSGTRTIIDSSGRTVEIPSTVERIVALGNVPRMITYLGLANKVVGISGMASDQITPIIAYAYANKELWANAPIVGTDVAGATDYYPEQIIAVHPDVILCSYTKELGDLAIRYCDRFVFLKDSSVFSYGGLETMTPENIEEVYRIHVHIIEYMGIPVIVPFPDEKIALNSAIEEQANKI